MVFEKLIHRPRYSVSTGTDLSVEEIARLVYWGQRVFLGHKIPSFRNATQGYVRNAKYDGTAFSTESAYISSTPCKLAMIESGHKQQQDFGISVERGRNLRETEGMRAEARLFFSETGKCSLRYLAFISWTTAVKGTCIASITPLLRKTAHAELWRSEPEEDKSPSGSLRVLHSEHMFVAALHWNWGLIVCCLLFFYSVYFIEHTYSYTYIIRFFHYSVILTNGWIRSVS